MEIKNLHGEGVSHNIAICWESDGFRHHFWLSDYNNNPGDFVIYRNLPLEHPGAHGFNARELESSKGYGAKVLPLILPHVPELIKQAHAEDEIKKAKQAESYWLMHEEGKRWFSSSCKHANVSNGLCVNCFRKVT